MRLKAHLPNQRREGFRNFLYLNARPSHQSHIRRSEPIFAVSKNRGFVPIRFGGNGYGRAVSDELEPRAEAWRLLNRSLNRAGVGLDLLVPRRVLGAIANGLIASVELGGSAAMRERSERQRWAALAHAATRGPRMLGFVSVGDGGLRQLSDRLEVSHTVLARSLKRWEERDRPLVKRFYGPRTTRYAPVAYVQVPLVTELVLWSAETLVPTTKGQFGPNVALVARSVELLAKVGTTGSTIGSFKDLERLNGELKRLLAGHD